MKMFGIILGPLINGVSSYFKTKAETKKAVVVAKAKLEINKSENENKVTMSDSEWELAGQQQQASSWKDEWVTIIFTAPIALVLIGAIWNAFTGNDKLLTGTIKGIEALTVLGLNWSELTLAVTLAAISLKVWRGR